MKSFYEFNRNSLQERLEQYKLYPEMALFHIALREEMGEEEYQAFYCAEREAQKLGAPLLYQNVREWTAA
ncbi:hypothetical protein CLV24_101359 [Pontibacter ummariensis]|uniref:Uncharacterized protein n=1 Tax=Pontibacter ummariensis TaxID=1610492 RepID=A0A239BHJ1_9BACT|nr:hypothetical protein [Pontibacter ummariensis]PRY16513.1 hypothetical protein CLV24_101359 [Pontibacter ummariensis]SNS06503.1 hypothetical protein SAMN06296052_101359 [Pontibacter ummariensis]